MPDHIIYAVLGRGGFATVYAARRGQTGKRVAIKVTTGDDRMAAARLQQEAADMRTVGPPFVPDVYDVGTLPDGSAFLAMEFLDSATLAAVMEESPEGMRPDEIDELAEGITAALAAVHAKGLLHRDLKPENLFIQPILPRVRVVDFGLARPVTRAPGSTHLTVDGSVLGTAEYMSPEQCRGQEEVDVRTDIYSVGVILYELATGRPPFWGPSADVKQAHLGRRPPPPSRYARVGPRLEQIILRCLAKAPEERYADVAELRLALAEARGEGMTRPTTGSQEAVAAAQVSSPAVKRLAALLFFDTDAPTDEVQAMLALFGGEVAHVAGTRYVGAIGEEAAENPLARAAAAAEAVVGRGFARHVVLELGRVSVQKRPDGRRRYLSPLFGRNELFPSEEEPDGVLATVAAHESLGVPAEPVPGREDLRRLLEGAGGTHTDATTIRIPAPRIIGRDQPLSTALEDARSAFERQLAAGVVILGEGGYGKSRFASALVDDLERRFPGVDILRLRSREPIGGQGDEVARLLLGRALGEPTVLAGEDNTARLVERLREEHDPDDALAVGLALGLRQQGDADLQRLGIAPGALTSRASRTLGDAIRARAAAKPMCIVLDDAHHAGRVTLDALHYAVVREGPVQLWVCLLARPAIERTNPLWGGRRPMTLDALAPADAADLCRELLQPVDYVPKSAIDRVIERTQGIPLLLVELCRAFKREGMIRRDPSGRSWMLATDELERILELPVLEWVTERELRALPADLVGHARLAALLGPDFQPEEMEGALRELERSGAGDEYPLDAGVALDRLVSAGVLTRRRGQRVAFRTGVLRDAVLRLVPEAQRAAVHQAALRHLRASTQGDAADRLPRLAYHTDRAGEKVAAAALYLELAARAQARHVYLDADIAFTRALELLPPDDGRRLVALRGRGTMHYRLGRYADALADLTAARALAEQNSDAGAVVDILLDEAMALDWMNEYHHSADVTKQASALLPGCRSALREARLSLAQGRAIFRQGDLNGAIEPLEEAAWGAALEGDAGYETLVVSLLMLATSLGFVGRTRDAERFFERVTAACERHGDLLHQNAVTHNLMVLGLAKHDAQATVDAMSHAVELDRMLGLSQSECRGEFNLAEICYQMGDLERAWGHLRRTIDMSEVLFGERSRPDMFVLKARMLLYEGNVELVRQVLDEIRTGQTRARLGGNSEAVLMPPEELLVEMVEIASRDATEAEWDDVEARAFKLNYQSDPLEVVESRGLAALRRGDVGAAVRHLERARELSKSMPNIYGPRIQARLDEARKPASAHVPGSARSAESA